VSKSGGAPAKQALARRVEKSNAKVKSAHVPGGSSAVHFFTRCCPRKPSRTYVLSGGADSAPEITSQAGSPIFGSRSATSTRASLDFDLSYFAISPNLNSVRQRLPQKSCRCYLLEIRFADSARKRWRCPKNLSAISHDRKSAQLHCRKRLAEPRRPFLENPATRSNAGRLR
jgi:hypothetical protein